LIIDSERGFLLDDARLDAAIAGAPGVMAVAPFITAEALLTQAGDVQGVRIVGVDPSAESAVTEVPRLMREGEFTALAPGSFGIVLGRGLANTLRVELGARVTLVLPEPMRTAVGVLPRLKAFTVVGIFEAGVQEYDEATAFVALADAARVFRSGGRMSGWRVRVSDPFAAPTVAGSLQPLLPALRIRDWTTLHTNLFRALQTEKIVMFVIMLLSVAVAAFNLVSTLVMVVGEKQSEIAVLATLGMTIMVSANDLLTLYVGLELAALPSYVLAAFHRQDDRSAEAGLKYFVLGALASGILLYGVTLIYGFSGSTQLDVIAGVVSGQTERSIGLLFGIVFILFDCYSFPKDCRSQ
jgi:ABC-type lipoprotein release transport system permease subunit